MNQHDLLRNDLTLVNGTETKNVTQPRVSLFVSVGDTHTTTSGHVEADKFTFLVDDSDETNIVGEEINIIVWRDGNSNLELKRQKKQNGNIA